MPVILISLAVLILILALIYKYKQSLEDCQKAYDDRLFELRRKVLACKGTANYYEDMTGFITKANSISSGLIGTYPRYIVEKIDKHENVFATMYEAFLQEMYSDFGMEHTVDELCDLIAKMQTANQYVKFAEHQTIKTLEKENREMILECFSRMENALFEQFQTSFSYDSPVTTLCDIICNMQYGIEHVNINDGDFQNRLSAANNYIGRCFEMVETNLDHKLKSITKDFLQRTNYNSISKSIEDVIYEEREFAERFKAYKLQPKSNLDRLAFMASLINGIQALERKIAESDDCYMISDDEYGRCDQVFYNEVQAIDRQVAETVAAEYEEAFKTGDFSKIIDVELRELSGFVWYYALLKPFEMEKFENLKRLYDGFFKQTYTAEIMLAELYYIKQMGGDSVIRERIRELLDEKNGKLREMVKYNVVIDRVGDDKVEVIRIIRKCTGMMLADAQRITDGYSSIVKEGVDYGQASSIVYELNRAGAIATMKYHHNTSTKLLNTIASGLMWIGAYDSEKSVLEYMLSKQLPLSQKQQERLHSLNNGGGNAPIGFAVESDEETLYFDVSSISWQDEQYKGFFENLAFEEKLLTYSVAVRDEDKELMVSSRVKLPDESVLLEKIGGAFDEEYGGTVTATSCECCALSGGDQENLKGILVRTVECSHLGILVHMACIGKKLTIKFFTLFMPSSKELNQQKQQLISLHKKMSPSVTLWENSLKATILMAFERLLNELPTGNVSVSDVEEEDF